MPLDNLMILFFATKNPKNLLEIPTFSTSFVVIFFLPK